jgi:hypothetical protein
MLNPVGRKGSNFKPNQQPHNNQTQSASTNELIARLQAALNNNRSHN